jgi:hypothetical protein
METHRPQLGCKAAAAAAVSNKQDAIQTYRVGGEWVGGEWGSRSEQGCHWEGPHAGTTGQSRMHVCLYGINIRPKLLLQPLVTDQYSRSVRDKTAAHLAPPPSAQTITSVNPADRVGWVSGDCSRYSNPPTHHPPTYPPHSLLTCVLLGQLSPSPSFLWPHTPYIAQYPLS